jgi:DNA-binding transcriptional regulator YbjK
MANAFKQKQDQTKRDQLLAACKATIERGGAVARHRAIEAYAKQASVTKEQAERALGLR